MQNAYIVTGTLTDAKTVALDEALPLNPERVRLMVEPLHRSSLRQYSEVLSEIRSRQRDRGVKPSNKEEIDAYLQSERESWEAHS